jgi:hypothetical protein
VVRMIGMAVTVRTVTVTVGAVTMRLAMVVACRRRHMMIGAQRAVHGKRKRRHDRESGRNPSAQQMGETNHLHTWITLHSRDPSQRSRSSPDGLALLHPRTAHIWWHSVKFPIVNAAKR